MIMMSKRNFDFRQYEKELSPFGKKVLQVLCNKWKKDGQSQEPHYALPGGVSHHRPDAYRHEQLRPGLSSSRRGLINFHDSSNFETSTQIGNFPNLYEPTDDHISTANFDTDNNTINPLPPVPTSTELVTTIEGGILENRQNLNTKDQINSVPFRDNKFRKPHTELHKTTSIEEEAFFNFNVIEGFDCNRRKIGWDDMFDTEILDTAIPVTENIITEPIRTNLFEICFPNGKTSTDNKTSTKPKKVSKKQKSNVETKQIKRKGQPLIVAMIPKKVKIIAEDEDKIATTSRFRKDQYTTTVKNWLDNIEPDVEIDKNRKTVKKSEIQIESKTKEKVTKKVVQAKLANKDGKMKFSKPTKLEENSTVDGLDKPDTEVAAKVVDKKEKEKKVKTKFVAPIKSQIPVRDVSYDIISIDNANTELGVSSLFSLHDCDVLLVLIHSNGFSQLNNHNTEETCDPEGVMLNVEDSYYYLKNQNDFSEIFTHILKCNRIICYEGKHILMYLKKQLNIDINFKLNIIDAKIGGSLLDPDNPPENFTQLQKLLSTMATYTISTECPLQKCAWYMSLLKESYVKLICLLKEEQLWNVFENIEMKLIPIIADMESQGVAVDVEKLKSLEALLLKKIKEVEEACYNAAGKVFQINSTVQVRTIIYDELQLDARCNVRVRETVAMGAKSTSEDMLRTLGSVHPLPSLVLQYRQLHKSYSTFISGVSQHIKNSLVKPTWVQNAAATGRIACNNPNLQAIPKAPLNLGTIPGENQEHDILFRSIYCAPEGSVFLAADFQQVECRVWAHVARDAAMTAALTKKDLFNALAADWLRKPESSISSEERERTKRLVYASLYGAGQRKLADILQLTTSQTQHLIDTFHCTFPSLKSFSSEVVTRCAAEGRLVSTGGRRRLLPQITSEDQGVRKHAERQAVNFIVQGSAADVCKMAMIESCAALRGCEARLLLQIHDELVFCVERKHLHRAAALVKQAMEGCGARCGLPLTLPVSLAVGDNWADMTPYQLSNST